MDEHTSSSSTRPSVGDNRKFFALVFVLAGLYLLVTVSKILPEFRGHPSFFLAVLAMTIAPPMYGFVLWLHRNELIPLDRHMLYLPLLIWYISFILVQSLPSHQKSMSNFFLESMAVVSVSGLYLLRFPIMRKGSPHRAAWVPAVLCCVVGVCSVLVTIAFPSMSE